jgi:SAM-dependent methyltransferase
MTDTNQARPKDDPSHSVLGFDDVDRAANPRSLVNYLTRASAHPHIQTWKRQTVELLELAPGAVVLDVGCGLGDEVRAMAHLVGPTGRAVGVDQSAVMVEEARRLSHDLAVPVEFHVGDAHALDFPDATFDRCRIERTLHHLADPFRVIAEMVRVTKPGGRIVALEPDWDTAVINGADNRVTRLILQAQADLVVRNGTIGRELLGLFHRAGLVDVVALPIGIVGTDYALARANGGLDESARVAQQAGLVTELEVAHWFDQLQQAAEEKRYCSGTFGMLVVGRRPTVP